VTPVVQPRARGSFIPHFERSHWASLIRADAIDLFGENEVTALRRDFIAKRATALWDECNGA
jgi:hypothetical protein